MSRKETKDLTVRLSEPLYHDLSTVADILGVPKTQIVRNAVDIYVAEIMSQPGFQDKLRDRIAIDAETLKRIE